MAPPRHRTSGNGTVTGPAPGGCTRQGYDNRLKRYGRPFLPDDNAGAQPLWGRCLCLLLGLLSLVWAPGSVGQSTVSEAQLRAGVIVAILRYTQWRDDRDGADLPVCVIGHSLGFETLLASGASIPVADRMLALQRLESIERVSDCAAVVVGRDLTPAVRTALARLPLLTICDGCDHAEDHTVNLFMLNQRIRFTVNLASAREAEVSFGAAMLELAAQVDP